MKHVGIIKLLSVRNELDERVFIRSLIENKTERNLYNSIKE